MPRSAPRERALAEACLERALVLDHPRATLWSRISLAHVLGQEQQPSSAAGELTLALALGEQVRDPEGIAVCRWRIGVLWARFGDLATARHHLDEGLRVARESGQRLLEGILLTNMAFTWGSEGQPDLYRTLSEEALAHFEVLEDHARADHVRCNLASAIVRQGDLEGAEALYDQVAAGLEPGKAPMLEGIILGGRAEAAFARQDPEKGRALSEASEAVLERGGLRYDAIRQRVLRAGQLTRSGLALEALALLESAIESAEPLGFRSIISEALHKLAAAQAALGNFEAAYSTLLRAVDNRSQADKEEVRQKYALLRDAQTAVAVAQQRVRSDELARINVQLREALRERDRLNLELVQHASTDPLTGARNRRGWRAYVEEQVRVASDPRQWALLLVDIDNFKSVNDHHGHSAGDAVLQHVAQGLQSSLTEHRGALLRIGGDEFALLLHDPSGTVLPEIANRWKAERAVTHPIRPDTQVTYKVSVGMTSIAAWEDVEQALDRADATMYRAKRNRGEDGTS